MISFREHDKLQCAVGFFVWLDFFLTWAVIQN